MIRLGALYLCIAFLVGYAWKDWFRSLCGLILLMGVIQHPDMPRNLLGIQGLNPWNVVLVSVLLAWAVDRYKRPVPLDFPVHLVVLLSLYFGMIVVSTLRMMADWQNAVAEDLTLSYVIGEHWINTFKWVIPGLLLFDGARTRERFVWGMAGLIGIYVLLGIQVIKWMPASNITSGDTLSYRALKVLQNEIGFSRVNLSMLLGGASWAILATTPLTRRGWQRVVVVGLSLATVYAQALTGGRTGYGTWAGVGLILCVVRWRRYLLALPVVLAGIVWLVPGARERMMQGFVPQDEQILGGEQVDDYQVTSGRTLIWPYVIEKIKEAPTFGYGREAMARTGLTKFLWEELGESFPHPHNAYLELLLDSGWVGFACVIPFYVTALLVGLRLFLDSRSPYCVAAGGVACSLLLALLIAAFGSQTFYPREGAVGMWCAFGLAFRVAVQSRQASVSERRELQPVSPPWRPLPAPAYRRIPAPGPEV